MTNIEAISSDLAREGLEGGEYSYYVSMTRDLLTLMSIAVFLSSSFIFMSNMIINESVSSSKTL